MYLAVCYLHKCFSFDETVEITSHVRYSFGNIINMCYVCWGMSVSKVSNKKVHFRIIKRLVKVTGVCIIQYLYPASFPLQLCVSILWRFPDSVSYFAKLKFCFMTLVRSIAISVCLAVVRSHTSTRIKLSYRGKTARRAMLVNSYYVSRGMGVRKV